MKKKLKRRIRLDPIPEPPKERPDGIIRAEGMQLDGCPVKFITKHGVAACVLELVQDWKTWKSGERVQVGMAEYKPF